MMYICRKVIGARYYNLGEDTGMEATPADTDGHGTHTSSTAAGSSVKGASLYGVAKGTARGGVPSARIAMYKVCGNYGCSDMSLLAAFDDAIADGVDVISISIGGNAQDFMNDVIAIGSFHAMKKGILTVCAGGNDGPYEGTINNVAPWIFTVAASNSDRKFETLVQLGNGIKISGMSINTFSPKKTMYPLTSSDLAYNGTGKIVLCLGDYSSDWTVKRSRGAGTIIAVDEPQDMASTTLIPASLVSANQGILIAHYINTTNVSGWEDPLSSGSGLLNPVDAVHPGLVYDVSQNDYIRYLCFEGYNGTTLSLVRGGDDDSSDSNKSHYNCSKFKPAIGVDGLNYPSMHVYLLNTDTHISETFQRTVTYVGDAPTVFKAKVTSSNTKGLSIKVQPEFLSFTMPKQKRSFKISVKGTITDDTPYTITAFFEWADFNSRVRSPILIYRPIV
ncbi:Subtilisin-like protease SBT4.15 [Bienertia sinuspersici]